MDTIILKEGEDSTGSSFGVIKEINIVVVGDCGTEKSSLIKTSVIGKFPDAAEVRCVLPPNKIPFYYCPYGVPFTIVDTSSRDRSKQLKKADAVVLTYACDRPETFDRITTFWLPELGKLGVRVPVMLVGCKKDLWKDGPQWENFTHTRRRLVKYYFPIEAAYECSAMKLQNIAHIFPHALRAILYPIRPLMNVVEKTINIRLVRVLQWVFTISDRDKDGALNNKEFNDLQLICHSSVRDSNFMDSLKRVITKTLPEGVNRDGAITLPGFLFLHANYVKNCCYEKTWTMVRIFGYNDKLMFREDFVRPALVLSPDQSVELTPEIQKFLKGIFSKFNHDLVSMTVLSAADVRYLFSTELYSYTPYKDDIALNAAGGLSFDRFLSMWELMAHREPTKTFATLIDMGYLGSLFHITRGRRLDQEKQQSERNVFQCFVFGAKEARKSTFLDNFIGRKSIASYTSTTTERFSVNVVHGKGQPKKTLILREIPEVEVPKMLSKNEFLAPCNVAVFIYHSSCRRSLEKAKELFLDVVTQGEGNDFSVPCLFVAAEKDLDNIVKEFKLVSQFRELGDGLFGDISGSSKDIFSKIVDAAEKPHENIPDSSFLNLLRQEMVENRREIGLENMNQD